MPEETKEKEHVKLNLTTLPVFRSGYKLTKCFIQNEWKHGRIKKTKTKRKKWNLKQISANVSRKSK